MSKKFCSFLISCCLFVIGLLYYFMLSLPQNRHVESLTPLLLIKNTGEQAFPFPRCPPVLTAVSVKLVVGQ